MRDCYQVMAARRVHGFAFAVLCKETCPPTAEEGGRGGRLLSVSEYSLSASSVPGSGLRAFFRHVIPSGLVLGPDLGDRMASHPDTCLALCYFKGLILKRKKEKYVSVHLLNCALLTRNTCSLLNVDTVHHRAREKCSLVREGGLQKVAQDHRTYLEVMLLDAASQKRCVVLLH